MKIIIPAIGSRGDVQPYIALCQGLKEAGHQVVLATNPTLAGLVSSYGIEVAPVGPPVDMGTEGAQIYAKAGRNWWLGFLRTMQLGFRLVQDSYPDILEVSRDADLVVVTDIFAGAAEADNLGIPWISVTLQPDRVPEPGRKVSPLVRLVFWAINKMSLAPVNRFRKKVGAAPFKDMGSMLSTRMTLLPVSPHVYPPKPNWPNSVHMTGYWFAHSSRDWTPPDTLLDFMEAGDRPIAVSLGAMSLSGDDARQAACITLEAIHKAGVRAVVQGWDEALQDANLTGNVYHAGSMPHSWLFEQAQAVIHHGGFGTTAASLMAGVPSIIIPHIIDQIYWGQRVVDLGVGPKYIHRANLTSDNLAAAIIQAVSDEQMKALSARLGEQIRSEPDGVAKAVRCIETVRQTR